MRGEAELIRTFCGISDEPTMRRFFREIFTEAERKGLGLRWQIMELLARGESQRRVSARLGVSLCKVTRGAKILKARNSVSGEVLRQKEGQRDE
jgi:TrpR family trp operon transcriptional repressor